MSEDSERTAAMIRDGSYYAQARDWYAALFINPVAERSFFLIIAGLAVLIATAAIFAIVMLTPIHARPGMIIRSERIDDVLPRLVRVKPTRAAIEPAMEHVLLEHYVAAREGYEISRYTSNYAFVVAHSDQPTGAAYAQGYSSANPQSPAALLGYSGQRVVHVDNITIDQKLEPRTAVVAFSTELINVASGNAKTRWTAQLQYYYTPTTITPVIDAAGKQSITTQDPQFQVVSYVVTQAP